MTKPYSTLQSRGQYRTGVKIRGLFGKPMLPVITSEEKKEEDVTQLDADIHNLIKRMADDTAINRETCFWRETVTHTSCNIVSSTIGGGGFKVISTDKKAQKLCNDWNLKINAQGQSILDFIQDMYIDNVVHGFGIWRILKNTDLKYNIDISRVDPKTITPYTHSHTGWGMFIQRANRIYRLPKSEREFYIQRPTWIDHDKQKIFNVQRVYVWIPDRPEFVVKLSLFQKPPMTSAIAPCIYKLWMMWFMRKNAEKHYSPFMVGKVGDPDHMPDDDDMLDEQLESLTRVMRQWRNFAGVALPGNQSIEAVKMDYHNTRDIIQELNYLDEIIGQAMGLPKAMVSAKGSQLASSRPIEQSFLRTVQAYRSRYTASLKKFYEEILLPANNITDAIINIDWPSLRSEQLLDYMGTIQMAKDTGVFLDRNEMRRAAMAVYPWLEELTGKDNVKFKVEAELTPKPTFGGGGFGNKGKPGGGETGGQAKPEARKTPSRGTQPEGQKSAPTQRG